MSRGETLPLLWVGDKLVSADEARIDPRDRGYTLGDGLFETMLSRQGRVPLLGEHLSRLRSSAEVLRFALPHERLLKRAVYDTLRANDLKDGVIRLTVSRGVPEGRGLLPGGEDGPSLIVQVIPFGGYPGKLYEQGVDIIIVSSVRRNEHSPLSRIKSLNYLDNIIARQEAAEQGATEAILCNTAGHIAGASAANVFFVCAERLMTPDIDSGALPGITRKMILRFASRLGFTIEQRTIDLGVFAESDGCFLTNVLMGIMPVRSVDGRAVGNERAWRIMRRLQDYWRLAIASR